LPHLHPSEAGHDVQPDRALDPDGRAVDVQLIRPPPVGKGRTRRDRHLKEGGDVVDRPESFDSSRTGLAW
jgi:hypothetical protein